MKRPASRRSGTSGGGNAYHKLQEENKKLKIEQKAFQEKKEEMEKELKRLQEKDKENEIELQKLQEKVKEKEQQIKDLKCEMANQVNTRVSRILESPKSLR